MRALVVLAVVGASCAAPAILSPTWVSPIVAPTSAHAPLPFLPPATVISRHHTQDELGRASYGYAFPGQFQTEARDASGNVAGAFSYVDADGKPVVAEYTAGVDGFRIRANNLPVAGGSVKDTPEVTAAKERFVELYNAAAIAAAEAPDEGEGEAVVAGLDDEGNVVVEQHTGASLAKSQDSIRLPEPVRDTPEVTAAKEEFVKLYNAAAIAAAEAPDDAGFVAGVDDQGNVVVETRADAENSALGKSSNAAARVAAALKLGLPEPVKDTPEVTAAKVEFMNLYNAAAIAAAEAPDDFSGTGTAQDIANPNDDSRSEAESGGALGTDIDLATDGPEVSIAGDGNEEVAASEVSDNGIDGASAVEEEVTSPKSGDDQQETAATETQSEAPETPKDIIPDHQEAVALHTRQEAPVSNNIDGSDAEASTGGSLAIHAALIPSGSSNVLAPWYVFGLTHGPDGKLVPLLSQRPLFTSQGEPTLTPLSYNKQGIYSYAHPYSSRFLHYIPPSNS